MTADNKMKSSNSTNKKGITTEDAYQKIKKMIYLNQLAPGQKLIYKDLSKRLNVSITPIIQALNRLEASSLVDYVPNKGYFVGEITETEARNLYEAREALEIFLLPKVVENLNSKKLDGIRNSFKEYRKANENGNRRELVLLDSQFHLKIAKYGHNEVIGNLLKQIFEQIYLKYKAEYLSNDRIKMVLKEHRELLSALRRSDVKDAIAITRKHVRMGMEHIILSLHANDELMIKQMR